MKKRRINKKILYVVLSVIIVSVLTLTIAYAVLSSTLTISGSSEVVGSSWNISVSEFDYLNEKGFSEEEKEYIKNYTNFHFLENIVYIGTAELIKKPIISGTTLSGLQISLTKPSDTLAIYYKVTNKGTVPAKVESMVLNTPSFSSSTNNVADVELLSNNWFTGFYLYNDVSFDSDTIVNTGDILCPGDTIYLEFGGMIYDTATAVPSSVITVSNLSGTVNFVQADKSTCS